MKRGLRTLIVAVAAVGVLGACASNPSARTVAGDIIDALDLDDTQKQCLRTQLEATTDEQLAAVAAGSETGNFGPSFDDTTVSQQWRDFVARLQEACGFD